jgi:tetratricopeptide (TPR) repeat protein
MPTPQEHADAAMAAATRGELAAAAAQFEAAARGFLAAGLRGDAKAALGNLAFLRKGCGDHAGALAAVDEALALAAPERPAQERAHALLTRAGILDRLADPRAAEAWQAAAEAMADQPLLRVVCLAHRAGALLPLDRDAALREARAALASLPPTSPASFLVGVLGAVGDSAPGAAGVPYLAQATLMMFAHPDTCNSSNAPFLEMLAERAGYAEPIFEPIAMIGLLLAHVRRGTPDHQAVASHVARLLQRAATARAISPEQLAAQCQRSWSGDPVELEKALTPLVGESWLVGRAPPQA